MRRYKLFVLAVGGLFEFGEDRYWTVCRADRQPSVLTTLWTSHAYAIAGEPMPPLWFPVGWETVKPIGTA